MRNAVLVLHGTAGSGYNFLSEAFGGHLFRSGQPADDQVNPPELGILEESIRKVPRGRAILLPISSETRGHGTHSLPAVWGKYLGELLAASETYEKPR